MLLKKSASLDTDCFLQDAQGLGTQEIFASGISKVVNPHQIIKKDQVIPSSEHSSEEAFLNY